MESTDTKEVLLEGFLAEKYGRKWSIRATAYSEIFDCIEANYPGFRKDLLDLYHAGGDISIQTGEQLMQDQDEYLLPIDKNTVIITPIPTGSKSGEAKILTAVLMVAFIWAAPAIGIGTGFGWAGGLANISVIESIALGVAVNLAAVGLQQLLAPDPSVDQNDTNYLFDGPENTVVGGNPVPVLCGEMIIGGVVISSGSIGGFHANDATWSARGNRGSGVISGGTGGYTGDVSIFGNGNVGTVFDVFLPPSTDDSALQDLLRQQRLGMRALGTDDYVL